jgi:hypothetical protein
VNRLNLTAGVLCLLGVTSVALLSGVESVWASDGALLFAGGLVLAGLLFLLAATGRTAAVAGRRVDLHDCSGLGDVAVGLAIFAGLASTPPGVDGSVYTLLVVLGGTSAVLFGVVGLAEKYDRL